MHLTCLPVGSRARLLHLSTDAFKSELLSVSFLVPLAAEQTQKNIMLLALSKRGTVSYPTQALVNRHLDEMYSTAVSSIGTRLGDREVLGFSADFLGRRYVGGEGLLPQVVDVLAELLRRPYLTEQGVYPADRVETEKRNLRDAIRAEINNPRAYAMARCLELLCPDEPFALSILGREEDVAGIDPAGLKARFCALQSEVAPVFCYVGAEPADFVAARLADAFDGYGGAGTPYQTAIRCGAGTIRKEETMPLSQGKLSLGFRTDLDDVEAIAPALVVLNEIYGASPASKLFLNVREKRSLCYQCSSTLYLQKGILCANSGMKPENRAVTEEAMAEEMRHIATGDITKTEWEAAMHSLADSYRQINDAPGVLARFYAMRALRGKRESVDEWRDRVLGVTREEVVELAKHLFLRAVFFLNGNGDAGEDDE